MEAEANLTNGWVKKVPENGELAEKEQLALEQTEDVTQSISKAEILEPSVVEDGVNPEPTNKDGNEVSAVTDENKSTGTKKVHIIVSLCFPLIYC
jgi:hypothetical protein